MNLYAVSYTWNVGPECGGLQIWCARDKEHLESMIFEHDKLDYEPWFYSKLKRRIKEAVERANVITNESAGMLASFTT